MEEQEIRAIASEYASKAHDKESLRTSTITENDEYNNRFNNFISGFKAADAINEKARGSDAVEFGDWLWEKAQPGQVAGTWVVEDVDGMPMSRTTRNLFEDFKNKMTK